MAQFDLVRQRFAPRCYKSFSRGLFQGFNVIASRQPGGLNFFGTFSNVSRSEQSRRTLRNWLDGIFLYICGGWQDRLCRYPCASVALAWRSVWRQLSLRLMLMSRKGRLTGEDFKVNLIEGRKELMWRIKSSSSCLVFVQRRN